MRRLNAIITVALALAAALAWSPVIGLPGFQFAWMAWTDGQIPLSVTLSIAACCGWIVVSFAPRLTDCETRCRRCKHILHGISEPRCPECGERI